MTRLILAGVVFTTLATAAHPQAMPSPIGPPMPRADGPSYVVVLRPGSAPRVAAEERNTPQAEIAEPAAAPQAAEQTPVATSKPEAKPAAKPTAKTTPTPHGQSTTARQQQPARATAPVQRPASVGPQTRAPVPPWQQQAGPPPRRLSHQQQAR
jgi:hypothetical protein